MVDYLMQLRNGKSQMPKYPELPSEFTNLFRQMEFPVDKFPHALSEIHSGTYFATVMRYGGLRFPFDETYLPPVRFIGDVFADPVLIRDRTNEYKAKYDANLGLFDNVRPMARRKTVSVQKAEEPEPDLAKARSQSMARPQDVDQKLEMLSLNMIKVDNIKVDNGGMGPPKPSQANLVPKPEPPKVEVDKNQPLKDDKPNGGHMRKSSRVAKEPKPTGKPRPEVKVEPKSNELAENKTNGSVVAEVTAEVPVEVVQPVKEAPKKTATSRPTKEKLAEKGSTTMRHGVKGLQGKDAVAAFDFKAENEGEIDLKAGEVLLVIDDTSDPDWCLVMCGKVAGCVPKTFLTYSEQ